MMLDFCSLRNLRVGLSTLASLEITSSLRRRAGLGQSSSRRDNGFASFFQYLVNLIQSALPPFEVYELEVFAFLKNASADLCSGVDRLVWKMGDEPVGTSLRLRTDGDRIRSDIE